MGKIFFSPKGLTPALSNQHQVTTFLNPVSHVSGAYALPLIQEAPLQHHFTVQHYYDKNKPAQVTLINVQLHPQLI